VTRIAVVNLYGLRAAVVLTDVPDDAPEPVKEGITRRNLTNMGGTCPCGAVMLRPNRAARRAGRVLPVHVVHEDDCPACDANLIEAWRGWRR
jgi:hypothetical protein